MPRFWGVSNKVAPDPMEFSKLNFSSHFANTDYAFDEDFYEGVQMEPPVRPPVSRRFEPKENEIGGVDSILTQEQIKSFGKFERRIEILGCNFKVVENLGKGRSLFRAIAQGLSLKEEAAKQIQKEIIDVITKQDFAFYKHDMIRSYIEVIPAFSNYKKDISDKGICDAYKKYVRKKKGPASTMELHAAGTKYGFNYAVIVFWKETELVIVNCNDPKLRDCPVRLYFLLTGKTRQDWHYELLLPLSKFIGPPDGIHEINFKHAILLQKENKLDPNSFVPKIPDHLYAMVFAIEDKEFIYKNIKSHNLFEILSHLLFGDFEHTKGKGIKAFLDLKRFALDCLLQTRSEKLTGPHGLNPYKRHPRLTEHRHRAGDICYLKLAVSEFKFSSIVFGMDSMHNFYSSKIIYYNQNDVDPEGASLKVPWYYFFVYHIGNRSTKWHLLDLISGVKNALNEISTVDSDSDSVLYHKLKELYPRDSATQIMTAEHYHKLRSDIGKEQEHMSDLWEDPTTINSDTSLPSQSKFIFSFDKAPSSYLPNLSRHVSFASETSVEPVSKKNVKVKKSTARFKKVRIAGTKSTSSDEDENRNHSSTPKSALKPTKKKPLIKRPILNLKKVDRQIQELPSSSESEYDYIAK